MPKLTKEVKKELKGIAAKLPKLPESKVLIRYGHEIASDESLKGYYDKLIAKNDFNPKAQYKLRTPGVKESVNHYKRLEKAYISGGMDSVAEYMAPYVKLARDIEEETKKQEEVKGE